MTIPNDPVTEFEFALVLSGVAELDERVVDALYQAGCDDATISRRFGTVSMMFDREAASLKDAILSAIRDVIRAGIGARVKYVDERNLVTQAEIARRIGRTRQQIGQYVSGTRGSGDFPGPICCLAEGQPLWMWCEVAAWLFGRGLIGEDVLERSRIVAGINSALDILHQRGHAPGLIDEVLSLAGGAELSPVR